MTVGAAVVTLVGCRTDSTPSRLSDDGDAVGRISNRHGHIAIVKRSQLDRGDPITLNIKGTSEHPHTIKLSRAQVKDIREGRRVRVLSTRDDRHNHVVRFN